MDWNLKNITYKQLAIIMEKYAMDDKANINSDITGLGYSKAIAESICDSISDFNTTPLVINDFGLILTKMLLERGVKEVLVCFGQWEEEYLTNKNGKKVKTKNILFNEKQLYNLYEMLPIIKATPEIKLVKMSDKKKFDLIIANPPYRCGAAIAKQIAEKIDYDEFFNLLPLGKYKKDQTYQHAIISDRKLYFAGDALTFPSLAKITKEPNNYESWETFILKSSLFDDSIKCLHKYIREQVNRLKNTLFVTNGVFFKRDEFIKENEFIANFFTTQDLVYSLNDSRYEKKEDSIYYKANILCESFAPFNYGKDYGSIRNQNFFSCFAVRGFKTKEEKLNFSKWWYSSELVGDGNPKHGLTSLLLKALGKERTSSFHEILPVVDWSIEQTDESILKDYGYTDDEIKEVLELAKKL